MAARKPTNNTFNLNVLSPPRNKNDLNSLNETKSAPANNNNNNPAGAAAAATPAATHGRNLFGLGPESVESRRLGPRSRDPITRKQSNTGSITGAREIEIEEKGKTALKFGTPGKSALKNPVSEKRTSTMAEFNNRTDINNNNTEQTNIETEADSGNYKNLYVEAAPIISQGIPAAAPGAATLGGGRRRTKHHKKHRAKHHTRRRAHRRRTHRRRTHRR